MRSRRRSGRRRSGRRRRRRRLARCLRLGRRGGKNPFCGATPTRLSFKTSTAKRRDDENDDETTKASSKDDVDVGDENGGGGSRVETLSAKAVQEDQGQDVATNLR